MFSLVCNDLLPKVVFLCFQLVTEQAATNPGPDMSEGYVKPRLAKPEGPTSGDGQASRSDSASIGPAARPAGRACAAPAG